MSKVNAIHKARLMHLEKWTEFVDERQKLLYEDVAGAKANKMLIKKFLGAEAAKTANEPAVKLKKPKVHDGTDGVDAAAVAAFDEKKTKRVPNEDVAMVSSVPGPPPPVSRDVFRNKAPVDEIVNITWVCDNMRFVDVDPVTCPSSRAWNMLCECRENAYFRVGFWKDHYGKTVPSKSTLDANKDRAGPDGKPTIDMIDRIQKIADEAEEESDGEKS